MTREQAINYLKSSGMSDEQIKAVVDAFNCEDAEEPEAESKEKSMKKYCVYFKGRVEFSSDSEDEDKILDEAYNHIFDDARTTSDADVTIVNMEIDEESEET